MKSVLLWSLLLSLSLFADARPQPQSDGDEDGTYEEEEVEETAFYDVPEFISAATQDVNVLPGTTMRLRCQVNNMNSNVLLMWTKGSDQLALGGRVLKASDRSRRMEVVDLAGQSGQALTIPSAVEADSGVYKCKIMAQSQQPEIAFNVVVGENTAAAAATPTEEETPTASAAAADDDKGDAAASATASLVTMVSMICLLLRL